MVTETVCMNGIRKQFPGVIALNDVDLQIQGSEIHGLVGENGAGKSTLINILAGIYPPSSGELKLFEQPVAFGHPAEALKAGIGIVYQETLLVPELTAEENIWLGRESTHFGLIRSQFLRDETRALCQQFDIEIPLSVPVESLRVAEQKLVEILRALSMDAKVLVFDEPTEAMSQADSENLFRILYELKERGLSILYVSHHLEEVFQICDRITILRNGEKIGTFQTGELTPQILIRHITDRDMEHQFPKEPVTISEKVALEVRNLTCRCFDIENVSLSVRQGEIAGVFGMVGSKRTELMRCISGATPFDSGQIMVNGEPVSFNHPRHAMDAGIYLCPEDRRTEGLVLDMTVKENSIMAFLKSFTRFGLARGRQIHDAVSTISKELAIKTPSLDQSVTHLSGGNQQKVVIAKWLIGPMGRVFIFDEPTKGIDIGAKVEVYRLMQKIAGDGAGVVFISSDLRELIGITDCLYVMNRGRVITEFERNSYSQETILAAALSKDIKG